MHRLTRATLTVLAASLALSACGGRAAKPKGEARYVARDVETLYANAKQLLDQKRFAEAAALFDEVERQHPYTVWARRAELMSAFAHWASRDYPNAIQAAQRFLSLHPGYKDAPYAYYIIAISYYEQINDPQRDSKTTYQAKDALTELIRRYPNSDYAADAKLKLDLVQDALAGKEMEIGRFYQRRKDWLASTIRFRNVVDNFGTTNHVPEALERLVESYLALGLPEEARKAGAVLNYNYPGSVWYERAYKLLNENKAA
ncbi:MAG: outer membrane protein assembly factor BamD [Sphingomonadaceae bacterium]|nr:outer membrane protein assembly factor BamD [Sphingomonadaceae bacterium]